MLDPQTLLNGVMGLLAILAGWIFRLMWSEISSLKERNNKASDERNQLALTLATDYPKKSEVDNSLRTVQDKISRLESIEVILANQYVTKADFTRVCDQILLKLDKLDVKLDKKADKP